MDDIIILKFFLSSVISKVTEASRFIIWLKEADFTILQHTAIKDSKLSLVSTYSPLSL